MTTIVKASCHCGLNAFNVPFVTEKLPVKNDLCHCNSCRHSTGQLMGNWVKFEGEPISSATNEPADLSHLIGHQVSEYATRWACSKCSAHILWQTHKPKPLWCIAVGTLERTEGIVEVSYHHWIADTQDGGISDYIKTFNGTELKRYAKAVSDEEFTPLGWHNTSAFKATNADKTNERLPAYCNCGTIQFEISRPTAASANFSSPYPDSMYPYKTTLQSKIANVEDEKWWLRPLGSDKPTKYLASHCACNTCRLTCGFEIQSWAFIPTVNIFDVSSGTPVPLNLQDPAKRPKGLKQYKSNPGRQREFCGKCGATVFWWGDERPEIVDLSVGLIDQDYAGAMAEDWLEWHKDRVSFEENAINRHLIRALEDGLKASA